MSFIVEDLKKLRPMKNYKKHVCTISHLELSMTVVNENCVENPQFSRVEDILKKTY